MRYMISSFSLNLLLFLAFTFQISAQQKERVIHIVNETGVPVKEIHLSAKGGGSWGDNLLKINVLADDESQTISFVPEKDACNYEIKLVRVNGEEMVFNNLNLCNLLNVTLIWEDGKPYVYQNCILENRTSFPIAEVYVSMAGSDIWGRNLLQSIVLTDYDTTFISFMPEKKTCFYDLKVVTLSGRSIYYKGISFCDLYKLTLWYDMGYPYYSAN